MGSPDFLSGFLDNFSDLEILLRKLLTEEELLKNIKEAIIKTSKD